MVDPAHWPDLTPERWEEARKVLEGRSTKGFSAKAAADAAKVPYECLLSWVARSAEVRPGDDPWIHEIAHVFRKSPDLALGTARDKMWELAHSGVAPALMQLEKSLAKEKEKREDRQAGLDRKEDDRPPLTMDQIWQRMQTRARIEAAHTAEDAVVLEPSSGDPGADDWMDD